MFFVAMAVVVAVVVVEVGGEESVGVSGISAGPIAGSVGAGEGSSGEGVGTGRGAGGGGGRTRLRKGPLSIPGGSS